MTVRRYDTIAQNYQTRTPLTPDQLAARRAKANTDQARRRRGRAIKGTGLLVTAALVVAGAPPVVHAVRAGAETVATTADNLVTSSKGLATEAVASVEHEAGTILDGQDKQTEAGYRDLGLSPSQVAAADSAVRAAYNHPQS